MQRILFRFCNQPQKVSTKKGVINSLRQEHITNAIVEQKKINEKLKPKEEYRAAILFNEILNREVEVPLYNTRGRIYWTHTIWYLSGFLLGGYGLYLTLNNPRWHKRNMEIFKVVITSLFILTRIQQYRRLYKYHIESVSYHTANKQFTLNKRNIIGLRKEIKLDKDKLLYTSDETLNLKKINYINIETLDCYSIVYDFAWIKKDFFSYLLGQHIK